MSRIPSDPRQRLLDAALKQFADRGYAGTSVQDITEAAKVTKPTLYYYFQSKEGLFQALVDQAMEERLHLIQQAAPPELDTVEQLTAIIVAVTDFARRKPDLLRLCFSIAFAAPGEIPAGLKNNHKMHESYQFVRSIVAAGLERKVLNENFTVDELTPAYFHLIQHSTVLTIFESRFKKMKSPMRPPPPMEPRRMVELFLRGASGTPALEAVLASPQRASHLAKAALATLGLAVLSMGAFAATTNQPPVAAPAPATPVAATTKDAPKAVPATTPYTGPSLADVRPIPSAVTASHPELATVSPVAQNANDPHALDLQTCFQFTAIRDDSLKISMQDIYIAQAQLSQTLAALWPSFTGSNQQQFLHYRSSGSGNSISIINGSVAAKNHTYTSQSNIDMTYTIFNGGQNWNNLAASRYAISAKKQTLARDYQTIYQSVAQAFYNVLQYQGDMVIQADLIDGLKARVEDLQYRVKLGRSRPSELLQAQTDLANAKVTYEQERGSLNASKETLAFYIGVPSSKFVLKDTQKLPTAKELESYLLRCGTRPDVLSQIETMRQAQRNLAVAEGQLYPTVTANGDFLASQDPANNQIDGTMTIQVSMPIFDGGLILGQINQNKQIVRQSQFNVEQLRRTADEDTRTAYANFEASISQVLVLIEAAQLAAKNLEAQVDDYRKGVVSNLDVLTALNDYQNARQGLHNSNMQARLNLINLHVAAGSAATGPGANNQALPKSSTAKSSSN